MLITTADQVSNLYQVVTEVFVFVGSEVVFVIVIVIDRLTPMR